MELKYSFFERQQLGQMTLRTAAEIEPLSTKGLPYLVLAKLSYRPEPNGLPSGPENLRLNKLNDEISRKLEPEGFVNVGKVNGAGAVVIAFYGPKPGPNSVTLKTGLLSKVTIPLESREDAAWSWFAEELQPSDVEYEASLFVGLHMQLRKLGDIASKSRNVDFCAFFPTRELAETFAQVVETDGYALTSQGIWDSQKPPRRFGCEFCKETSVEPAVIGSLTASLRKKAGELGGEFDGWACPVVKE